MFVSDLVRSPGLYIIAMFLILVVLILARTRRR
jgi:hypothetical protein